MKLKTLYLKSAKSFKTTILATTTTVEQPHHLQHLDDNNNICKREIEQYFPKGILSKIPMMHLSLIARN